MGAPANPKRTKYSRNQIWTIEEDLLLRTYYSTAGVTPGVPHIPGRAKDSVKGRAVRLGLYKPKTTAWTKDIKSRVCTVWDREVHKPVTR